MGKRSDYSCIILNVIEKLYSYEEYIYILVYIYTRGCVLFFYYVYRIILSFRQIKMARKYDRPKKKNKARNVHKSQKNDAYSA